MCSAYPIRPLIVPLGVRVECLDILTVFDLTREFSGNTKTHSNLIQATSVT